MLACGCNFLLMFSIALCFHVHSSHPICCAAIQKSKMFAGRFARSVFRAPVAQDVLKGALRTKYSDLLVDHYENPRNVGSMDVQDPSVGTGLVGAPACGDVMKLQLKVDSNGVITETAFKTFGCGAAIASSSLATEHLKGKTLEEAAKLTNKEIAAELLLPPVKLHCSMLAEEAVKAAVKNLQSKRLSPAKTEVI